MLTFLVVFFMNKTHPLPQPVFATACQIPIPLPFSNYSPVNYRFLHVSFIHVLAFCPSFRWQEEKTNSVISKFAFRALSLRHRQIIPQISAIDFFDLSRRFLMSWTSDSRFPDLLTSDWIFIFHPLSKYLV